MWPVRRSVLAQELGKAIIVTTLIMITAPPSAWWARWPARLWVWLQKPVIYGGTIGIAVYVALNPEKSMAIAKSLVTTGVQEAPGALDTAVAIYRSQGHCCADLFGEPDEVCIQYKTYQYGSGNGRCKTGGFMDLSGRGGSGSGCERSALQDDSRYNQRVAHSV